MDRRNTCIICAFLIGFLYRILISLQGIDHIDSGFSNTFFQNIFTHPETMTFYFNYYLTGFFGGLWYQFAGNTGMLGFRLLEAVTVTASVFFIYKTFERQLTNTRHATWAILASFLFPTIVTTFHYNTLSFLFLSLTAWSYSRYIFTGRSPWLFLSGMLLGCCFFVRIVNLALGILVLVPVVEAWLTRQRSLAIKRGAIMLSGMLSSCIILLGMMYLIGHLSCFLQGLSEAFGFFHSDETSHASGNLFKVYLKSYVNILLQMSALCLLGWLYLRAERLSASWRNACRVLLIIGALLLVSTSLPYLSALSLCTLLLVYLLFSDVPREHKLILSFVMVGAYVFPFGSDIGIAGIYHWIGGILIIPAAIVVGRLTPVVRKEIVICSLCIAAVMLWKTMYRCYGEHAPRWECTEQVGDCMLNTFTSPDKAEDFRHVIAGIRQHTADNKWLVIGNQASEVYYATETIPFLGNTQLGVYIGTDLLKRLDRQTENYHRYPVIVFLKKEHFIFKTTDEMQSWLSKWIKTQPYEVAIDNEFMTLFTPTP